MVAKRMEVGEWSKIAESFHRDCFGEEGMELSHLFDYAVTVDMDGEKMGYSTIKELDSETAHIVYGGVLSAWRNRRSGVFHEIVAYLKPNYKRIGFATKTRNKAMIKLGIDENFEIVGLKQFNKIPYLEFLLEV